MINGENTYRSLDDSQLRKLRAIVRGAEASLDCGQGAPLDVEAMVDQVRARLAKRGVVDQPPTSTS